MNLNRNSDYAIFELGINNPNEMNKLVKTLKPHYSLVTGIENSHIGNFKNFKHLVNNKLNIFNSNRLIRGLINFNYDPKYIKNKLHPKVKIINIDNIKKNISVTKKLFSIHFIENYNRYKIESSKGGVYENIAIITFLFLKKIITKFQLNVFFYDDSIIESRGNEVLTYINEKRVKFFDHSYNASPYSLNKQIISFNERKIKQKVYILGSMKELGKKSDFYHLQIIKLVIQLDLEKIIFIGEEFYKFKNKFKKFNFYKKYEPATKYITNNIDIIKNIFVMGSRYYKLDRIIKTYVR